MDFKSTLEKTIDIELEKIKPTIENFPWESNFHYGTWCVQTYKFVYHTVPLLEKTAKNASGDIKNILLHHRDEELGHEKFAQRDAAFLGRDAVAEPTMNESLDLYQPISDGGSKIIPFLFGYAFALEHISAAYCGYMADRVLRSHGKKKSQNHQANIPASFLTLHAVVDIEHTETGWECLSYLDPQTHGDLMKAMMNSFNKYGLFLKAIMKQTQLKAA